MRRAPSFRLVCSSDRAKCSTGGSRFRFRIQRGGSPNRPDRRGSMYRHRNRTKPISRRSRKDRQSNPPVCVGSGVVEWGLLRAVTFVTGESRAVLEATGRPRSGARTSWRSPSARRAWRRWSDRAAPHPAVRKSSTMSENSSGRSRCTLCAHPGTMQRRESAIPSQQQTEMSSRNRRDDIFCSR